MTTLDQLTSNQSGKFVTVNDNFSSVSPAAMFGRRPTAHTGLTWGYYGGTLWGNNAVRTITNSTVSLTASANNYIGLDIENLGGAPAITVNTTGFVDGEIRLYVVTTNATDITAEVDHRNFQFANPQGQDPQVIVYAASITPDTLAGVVVQVGALTGALTVNAPANPFLGAMLTFTFAQDATGGRIITWNAVFKKAPDIGATANARGSISFIYDGTNWLQIGGALNFDGSDVQTYAYAATITPDALFGEIVDIGALTAGITIGAPTNPYIGAKLTFLFVQDATGGRVITWNAVFKRTAETTGTANQVGTTTFVYDGTNWLQNGGALIWFS